MITPDGILNLVRRAQMGDRLAQTELLERIQPDLERFSRQFGVGTTAGESVSDLTQDAALRFWERLAQFQGASDDSGTAAMLHDWLEQMVRRLAANHHEACHALKRRPDLPLLYLESLAGTDSQGAPQGLDVPGNGPTPSAVVGAAERQTRVHTAIQKIVDPTDRQILEMCFLNALSLRAIARELHVSLDRVRERYHACLRFLERELEELL
jgi:RNA polymerase sigma factor (sigma-70 family)